MRIISQTIVQHCPNIVGLGVHNSSIPDQIILALFQHYGHQLEIVNIGNQDPKFDRLVSYLNPTCLRELHVQEIDLATIVHHFPLLSRLSCLQTELNLNDLAKLVHLTEFYHDCNLTLNDFRSFLRLPFVPNLIKLEISCYQLDEQVTTLFANLKSLRCLRFKLEESPLFDTLFIGLHALEYLDLYVNQVKCSHSKHFEQSLQAMSQLKCMKKLRIFIWIEHPTVFSFRLFHTMISIVELQFSILIHADYTPMDLYIAHSKIMLFPLIFPNLVHLHFNVDAFPSILLIEIIARLKRLKSLKCHTKESELKEYCNRHNIVLK